MIKIAAIAVISVVLILILKQYRNDYSVFIKLSAIIIICLLVMSNFENVSDEIDEIAGNISVDISFLPIVFKTILITIVTQIASDICRDNAENALATVTELAGKLSIIIICLPMFKALLTLCLGLVEG